MTKEKCIFLVLMNQVYHSASFVCGYTSNRQRAVRWVRFHMNTSSQSFSKCWLLQKAPLQQMLASPEGAPSANAGISRRRPFSKCWHLQKAPLSNKCWHLQKLPLQQMLASPEGALQLSDPQYISFLSVGLHSYTLTAILCSTY